MQLKKLFLLLVGVFFLIFLGLYLLVSKEILSNFTVAYLSSSIIILSSFNTYKNLVHKRLEHYQDGFDDRDYISKVEDPYALDEEIQTTQDIKDVIKKEKEFLKQNKRGLKAIFSDSVSAFSFERIIAYVLLVAGFFYLLENRYLNVKYFLLFLIFPNIIVLIYLLKEARS